METKKIVKVIFQMAMVYTFIIFIIMARINAEKFIERASPTILHWLLISIVLVSPLIILYLINKDNKYAGIIVGIPTLWGVVDDIIYPPISTENLLIIPILVISGFYTYAYFKKEKSKK